MRCAGSTPDTSSMSLSSSGQDTGPSTRRPGFDSPQGHQRAHRLSERMAALQAAEAGSTPAARTTRRWCIGSPPVPHTGEGGSTPPRRTAVRRERRRGSRTRSHGPTDARYARLAQRESTPLTREGLKVRLLRLAPLRHEAAVNSRRDSGALSGSGSGSAGPCERVCHTWVGSSTGEQGLCKPKAAGSNPVRSTSPT